MGSYENLGIKRKAEGGCRQAEGFLLMIPFAYSLQPLASNYLLLTTYFTLLISYCQAVLLLPFRGLEDNELQSAIQHQQRLSHIHGLSDFWYQ